MRETALALVEAGLLMAFKLIVQVCICTHALGGGGPR